jgi:hypothetical protein
MSKRGWSRIVIFVHFYRTGSLHIAELCCEKYELPVFHYDRTFTRFRAAHPLAGTRRKSRIAKVSMKRLPIHCAIHCTKGSKLYSCRQTITLAEAWSFHH